MEIVKFFVGVLIVVFFGGCAIDKYKLPDGSTYYSINPTKSDDKPLTKEEIKQKIIGSKLYRDTEVFYFGKNGIMIYIDKETGKKERGSWYLRSALVSYKNNRRDDMLCLAIGKTDPRQFSYTPCLRLFKEKDKRNDLYLGVSADCRVGMVDPHGNIPCDFKNRTFGYYRISNKKLK